MTVFEALVRLVLDEAADIVLTLAEEARAAAASDSGHAGSCSTGRCGRPVPQFLAQLPYALTIDATIVGLHKVCIWQREKWGLTWG